VKGTVTEVLWVNPHVYVHIAVDKDGKADDWVVELGSMNNIDRMGWTRERVKAGDPLTITGWRGKPAKVPYPRCDNRPVRSAAAAALKRRGNRCADGIKRQLMDCHRPFQASV
jgi:hypothetical protein